MRLAALFLGLALCLPAQFNWRRAPGFSLPDSTQQYHDLADYRGKVVILDIMQTTCPHCQQITPLMEEIRSKYAGKVQVLSIVTLPDNAQTVRGYIAKYRVTAPMLFDCGQVIASYLKLSPTNPTVHFPTLFIIDRNGMIRTQLNEADLAPEKILGALEAALR